MLVDPEKITLLSNSFINQCDKEKLSYLEVLQVLASLSATYVSTAAVGTPMSIEKILLYFLETVTNTTRHLQEVDGFDPNQN